jgi:hypothetical protein
MAVWSRDNAVNYSPLTTWTPQPVFVQYSSGNEATSLDAATIPGGAAIAYSSQGEDGVDIVAAFYDANQDKWSLPRQLTHDDSVEGAVDLAWNGNEFVISYLKTQTQRIAVDFELEGVMHYLENVPQPGRTDLYVLRHALGHDPAISASSVIIDPPNPLPGTTATIRANIDNLGDLIEQGVQIGFYDGDPDNGGTLIGSLQWTSGLLLGGQSQQVQVSWVVPAEDTAHELFVVVDPAVLIDDRDRSNNSVSVRTVLPDLTIQAAWNSQVGAQAVVLVARVTNTGSIPSNSCQLSWHLDAVDGPVIGESNVDAIGVGDAVDITLNWNTQALNPGDFVQMYTIADSGAAVTELDETNNTISQTVQVPQLIAGDLNGDGIVNAADIDAFVAVLLGLDINPYHMAAADTDGNGVPNGKDIMLFTRYLVGL